MSWTRAKKRKRTSRRRRRRPMKRTRKDKLQCKKLTHRGYILASSTILWPVTLDFVIRTQALDLPQKIVKHPVVSNCKIGRNWYDHELRVMVHKVVKLTRLELWVNVMQHTLFSLWQVAIIDNLTFIFDVPLTPMCKQSSSILGLCYGR